MFDVSVGEYCGDCWTNSETCTIYIFYVENKKQRQYQAILWVSEDGRVIGSGSLITGVDTMGSPNNLKYRIK